MTTNFDDITANLVAKLNDPKQDSVYQKFKLMSQFVILAISSVCDGIQNLHSAEYGRGELRFYLAEDVISYFYISANILTPMRLIETPGLLPIVSAASILCVLRSTSENSAPYLNQFYAHFQQAKQKLPDQLKNINITMGSITEMANLIQDKIFIRPNEKIQINWRQKITPLIEEIRDKILKSRIWKAEAELLIRKLCHLSMMSNLIFISHRFSIGNSLLSAAISVFMSFRLVDARLDFLTYSILGVSTRDIFPWDMIYLQTVYSYPTIELIHINVGNDTDVLIRFIQNRLIKM